MFTTSRMSRWNFWPENEIEDVTHLVISSLIFTFPDSSSRLQSHFDVLGLIWISLDSSSDSSRLLQFWPSLRLIWASSTCVSDSFKGLESQFDVSSSSDVWLVSVNLINNVFLTSSSSRLHYTSECLHIHLDIICVNVINFLRLYPYSVVSLTSLHLLLKNINFDVFKIIIMSSVFSSNILTLLLRL